MENIVANKRGRKPKSHIIPTLKTYNNLDTPIIAHLPIEYSDIIDQNDIFIKMEPIVVPKVSSSNKIEINKKNDTHLQFVNLDSTEYKFSSEKEIKLLKNKIEELNAIIKKNDKLNNKPNVQPLNSDNSSKCWWCSYNCDPIVELPEHYFNNMFYTNGKFCSYNCAMAYNIDLNDENISKRNSLLYLHYKKTYNTSCIITPAPSWKILKDFGGSVTIEDFRSNFITHTFNYLYIKPPLISRIAYVEKTPVIEETEIIKPNEFILKRSKPLNSTKYTLESTIGLKKIIMS
jgi:hypothetical protein